MSSGIANIIPAWWYVFADTLIKTNQASESYRCARPNCKSEQAGHRASMLLKTPKFQAFFKSKVEEALPNSRYDIRQYYDSLVGIATFDIADLYETDSITKETRLKPDWLDIARKHKALDSIQCDIATLESGMVIQRIKLKPISKLHAIEKLGKLLGFDKTEQAAEDKKKQAEEVQKQILESMQTIKGLIAEKKIDTKTIDVDALANCEILEE